MAEQGTKEAAASRTEAVAIASKHIRQAGFGYGVDAADWVIAAIEEVIQQRDAASALFVDARGEAGRLNQAAAQLADSLNATKSKLISERAEWARIHLDAAKTIADQRARVEAAEAALKTRGDYIERLRVEMREDQRQISGLRDLLKEVREAPVRFVAYGGGGAGGAGGGVSHVVGVGVSGGGGGVGGSNLPTGTCVVSGGGGGVNSGVVHREMYDQLRAENAKLLKSFEVEGDKSDRMIKQIRDERDDAERRAKAADDERRIAQDQLAKVRNLVKL